MIQLQQIVQFRNFQFYFRKENKNRFTCEIRIYVVNKFVFNRRKMRLKIKRNNYIASELRLFPFTKVI